ncbi:hypothetical protein F3Y22_tig00116962pilonHSYRG00495 [Hibiscus syriacus]|uniref:Uncharacterized protein n=1 Tax=Hibiscus syriacus TaxID=106335 RepID=A0A6A2WW43_HIBSY|nr:peroxisomal and mitochondrial division factor 2-like [Hibiscus syriacus]KAE8659470.1 hypothetical protein F3Y22_tig00116962pilonHSYRG00495 [Hibiscus syriacus]
MEAAEKFHNTDKGDVSELLTKIEALKSEKLRLSDENKGMKEKVNKLDQEVGHLHAMEEETDEWDEEESSEAKQEVVELKRGLEEKVLMIERLRSEIAEFRKEKVKAEKKGRELETKIGILEVRAKDEWGKKTRVQEEMKQRINEFRKKIQYLEDEVAETRNELRRRNRVKLQCEKKVMGLEKMMLEFKDTVDEKTIETAMSGKVRDIGCEDKGANVPIVVAGGVAAIVVAAAVVNRCPWKRS